MTDSTKKVSNPNRAQRRSMRSKAKLHLTKKVTRMRGKTFYGGLEVTKFANDFAFRNPKTGKMLKVKDEKTKKDKNLKLNVTIHQAVKLTLRVTLGGLL